MARNNEFLNEMILNTLNQYQQTIPPSVQKEASLDDVGEIFFKRSQQA